MYYSHPFNWSTSYLPAFVLKFLYVFEELTTFRSHIQIVWFFLQVCHLILDYHSVSSQLKKGIFFLFPFPFGTHWPASLVKMVRFRFSESQCLKNWSETQPILLASTCVHIDTYICTCIGTHSANLHPQNFKTLKDEPSHRMVCRCVYLHKHTTLLICSLSRGFLRSSQVFAAVNSIVLNMPSHVCWYVCKITPVSAIAGFSTIHYFPGWYCYVVPTEKSYGTATTTTKSSPQSSTAWFLSQLDEYKTVHHTWHTLYLPHHKYYLSSQRFTGTHPPGKRLLVSLSLFN